MTTGAKGQQRVSRVANAVVKRHQEELNRARREAKQPPLSDDDVKKLEKALAGKRDVQTLERLVALIEGN